MLRCNSPPRSFGDVIDRRKAEVAAYAIAAFVVVLLAMRLLHRDSGGGSGPKLALEQPSHTRSRSGASTSGGTSGRVLVIDVAGEVRRPGVYRVPAGARAELAVVRAGGVTKRGESTAVNLAMPLRDGQQIIVPRKGATAATGGTAAAGAAAGAGGAGGGVASAQPAQPISLSSATVAQLDTLDGIGPTLAGRIIQYRDSHGGFHSIEELRQVDGIGDKRFAALRKAVQP